MPLPRRRLHRGRQNDRLYLQTASAVDPLVYYNLGYASFKQHDFAGAQSQFTQYIKSETPDENRLPRIADACTRLADCLYGQRRFAEAEATYNKAVALYPAMGDYALYQQGFMAGLQKKQAEKIAAMQQLRQRYPQSDYIDEAWLEEGLAHVTLHDGKAATCFTALLEKYPDQATARKAGVQLGMLYYNDKQPQKAIATYKSVIADYPGTEEAHIAPARPQSRVRGPERCRRLCRLPENPRRKRIDRNLGTRLPLVPHRRTRLPQNPQCRLGQPAPTIPQKIPPRSLHPAAHHYLSLYYLRRKEYGKAARNSPPCCKSPIIPIPKRPSPAWPTYRRRAKSIPKPLSATKKLERLASRKESRQLARLGMLRTAVQLGDNRTVIEVSARLLADPTLSPEHIRDARAARAGSFIALGDSAQGRRRMARKLAEDPRTETGAKAAYQLAQYHFDKGDDTQAEAVVNRLLEDGTSHQYWLARGFIVLADVYTPTGATPSKPGQYLLSLQNNYTADDDIKGACRRAPRKT